MNAEIFTEWFMRSLLTGAVAVTCVRLCPVSWRGRFRLWVPILTFATLAVLAIGLIRPLPRIETPVLAPLANVSLHGEAAAWVMVIWCTGAALLLLRQAVGFWSISRFVSRSSLITDEGWASSLRECQARLGLHGSISLRLAGRDFIPSATGLWRRSVLLPDEAIDWNAEQRRLVLLHELGHFQRRDLWTDALGRLVCALHWFNPFAWMLQRMLALEREFACDALVVNKGASTKSYALLLWQMATAARRRPSALAAAFLAMAEPHPGKLEQRVSRILDAGPKFGAWGRLGDVAMCFGLAVGLVLCTACQPVARVLQQAASGWSSAEIEKRLIADPFPGL